MKKRVLVIMGLCILLMAGGCTKKGAAGDLNSDSTATVSPTAAAAVTGVPVKEDYVASDYVTLGNYKGVAVDVTKLTVTDADVEAAIQTDLESNPTLVEITDRKDVQDGDIVNIDYEGLKDGVAFDGGTKAGDDLTIGSGSFIEGFEDGLIGHKVGEKVVLNLTFPEDYQTTDLAGQAVVFNVTINKIQKSEVSELTEDYVKNNTDYDSIEAYKKAKREDLEAANQDKMNNNKTSNVITAILDASTISSYPQSLLDFYAYTYENYITQMFSYYGTTVEDYLAKSNMTQEDFDKNIQAAAKNYASLELVERAIADAEGITLTDDEYKEALNQYMTNYGVTTEEELLKVIAKEEIQDELLLKKALDFAVENAVVTEVEPTPTPVATTAPAAE